MGSGKDQVGQFGTREVCADCRIGTFAYGARLAAEGGLVDTQLECLDQAAISRDGFALA